MRSLEPRTGLPIPALLVLFTLFAAAPVQAADTAREVSIFTGIHPAAETLFVPSLQEVPSARVDGSWYIRTGARKGLSGQAITPEELFAAPDVAVLNRGFAPVWSLLLAEQREAFVLVGPDEIAGLAATKPFLIIPAGALSGTAGSAFFKAGLAHYVRNGGIIYCLAQQTGRDYSALPVPEGSRIDGAGWAEDSGPLFRASTARAAHILLRGLNHSVPAVETEGFFTAFPGSAQVLLTRRDGAATLIAYPFGNGWVVAGTLFTDFQMLLGDAENDEKLLLRNLLSLRSEPLQSSPSSTHAVMPAKHVPRATTPDRAQRADQPVMVYPFIERKGGLVKLTLELPAHPGLQGETLLARMNGQEQTITPGTDRIVLSAEIPLRPDQRRVSFALYRTDGSALVRGSVAAPSDIDQTARLERQQHFPGDRATVAFRGIGKAEATLRGLDYLDNKIMAEQGSIDVPIPGDLPAGAYPLQWMIERIDGQKASGVVSLDLCGYRVTFAQPAVETRRAGAVVKAKTDLRITAGSAVSGKLQVQLRGPGGQTTTVAEPAVGLAKGSQTIPVSFEFSPELSGLWQLTYVFSAMLPQGAGLPTMPVELASAGTLIDVGSSTILAVTQDSVFYYEPSGKAGVQAVLFGTGPSTLSLHLNGKKIAKEQVLLAGAGIQALPLPLLGAGSHRVGLTLTSEGAQAEREHLLVYGLSFPDLRSTLTVEGPRVQGEKPVLPLRVVAKNHGKGPAASTVLALYDGDPAKGAKALAKLDVPPLAHGQGHTILFDLPLFQQAGTHALYAVVDPDRMLQESREDNNASSAAAVIPEILLLPDEEDRSFSIGDPMNVLFSVFNLTSRAQKDLSFTTIITDPAGKKINADTAALPLMNAGEARRMPHALKLPLPSKAGIYGISANISRNEVITSASQRFTILPTLLLTGSLEGSSAAGILCNPFSARFSIRTGGNILPTSGKVRFEMATAGSDKPPLIREFPLRMGDQSFAIDRLDLPPGTATMRLKATASNEKNKMTREFMLAERTVPVTGPVVVSRKHGTFPRVLVWLGREGRTVEQAVTEAITKQAFDQDHVMFRIVHSEEAFTVQSRTGMFNTYVLIEPQEMPSRTDWFRDRAGQGEGVVLIGAGTVARQLGEILGFSFEEAGTGNAPAAVNFVRDPEGIDLTGSLPVNGMMLYPKKKGTTEAGVYSFSGRPAVLVDGAGQGKVVLMPVSFSSSAYTSGAPGIYSMVLRSLALFAAPESDTAGTGPDPVELSVASRVGTVRARLEELLPPGSRPVWTSGAGRIKGSTIIYEVTAEKEPKKLLYLYELPQDGTERPGADVLYECNGSFVSQGRIE